MSASVNSAEITVAVEIKPDEPEAPIAEHFHATKAMHQIAFEHTFTPEMWEILISNPDSGTYYLTLVDSVTKSKPQLYKTETMSADASASTLRGVLNKFY